MIHLDDMLKAPEAAKWLQMSTRELLAKAQGRRAAIPGFWLNDRVVRFHPRTIIARLAADSGVDPEVIAASLNLKEKSVPFFAHEKVGKTLLSPK